MEILQFWSESPEKTNYHDSVYSAQYSSYVSPTKNMPYAAKKAIFRCEISSRLELD